MKRISKKKYFLMAVLSALCAVPMAVADKKSPESNLKSVAKADALKIEEDFDAVLKAAKADGKKILLEFSGNDWCPPCQMLQKFVLKTKEFAKYAKEKLHVVVADFDRYGEPINKRFSSRYKELAELYGLRGFPTIIILSSDGKILDKIVGLQVRSPKELIARINQ